MPVRKASAVWEGGLKGGSGTMRMESGAYEGAYSFASRFEEGTGTNPEELIASAHAGCFSMALAAALEEGGYSPKSVNTTARVRLKMLEEGPTISDIELTTEANVPDIDEDTFMEFATGAKENCPVSRALAAVENVTVNATLVS